MRVYQIVIILALSGPTQGSEVCHPAGLMEKITSLFSSRSRTPASIESYQAAFSQRNESFFAGVRNRLVEIAGSRGRKGKKLLEELKKTDSLITDAAIKDLLKYLLIHHRDDPELMSLALQTIKVRSGASDFKIESQLRELFGDVPGYQWSYLQPERGDPFGGTVALKNDAPIYDQVNGSTRQGSYSEYDRLNNVEQWENSSEGLALRQSSEVSVQNGRLMYQNASGEVTALGEDFGSYTFVVDSEGRMMALNARDPRISEGKQLKHSTFTAGAPVKVAGNLKVSNVNGRLRYQIDDGSGHYKPDVDRVCALARVLIRQGISPLDIDVYRANRFNGGNSELIEDIRLGRCR